MNRREFLFAASAGALAGCMTARPLPTLGSVMSVRGPIAPSELGITLAHEHAMVDFRPLDTAEGAGYDPSEVVETVLPHLTRIRELGVQTFVDATPAYLGRDPVVLRALSERSGLHILTNTGYYGARNDAFLPEHAFEESAETLAERWILEWREGIGGTSVRPGFVKIGVDPGSLSDMDATLIRAAAITHRETGLTIASHTGSAEAALEQIDVLREEGVDPSAWIWVHAHVEEDLDAHVQVARRGAWVELDGIGPNRIDRHVELVQNMMRHRLLGRVLVSQDAGWYSVGENGGGDFRGYETLFTDFVPALREAGVSDQEVGRLLRINPAEAFRTRVRRAHRSARPRG